MLSLKIYLDLILILIMLVGVLVSVAFLTLMERKVLGYIHLRLGPNKILYMGIMQPFSDAVKLFVKEFYSPWMSNYLIYYFSPIISLFLSLIIWFVMPLQMNLVSFNYSILFMIVVLSLGIYPLMISGWSSNSNYAMLGCLRAIAQVISYEVVLIFILLSLIFFINSLNFYFYGIYQYYIWFIFFFMWLSFCWFTCMMAETNRTPFDLAEGESELVSGFNIEYGSGGFALIFMAEYASILFMSLMFSVLFLGSSPESFFFYLKLCLMVFMFIWVRGLMPRCRYDKLMYLTWKIYLPISLNFLLFYLGIKLFLY